MERYILAYVMDRALEGLTVSRILSGTGDCLPVNPENGYSFNCGRRSGMKLLFSEQSHAENSIFFQKTVDFFKAVW